MRIKGHCTVVNLFDRNALKTRLRCLGIEAGERNTTLYIDADGVDEEIEQQVRDLFSNWPVSRLTRIG